MIKQSSFIHVVMVCGLVVLGFSTSGMAEGPPNPFKGKGKPVNPGFPWSGPQKAPYSGTRESEKVRKPSPPRLPVARYSGPRSPYLIPRGRTWFGTTIRIAPYHRDYDRFTAYPVEVAVQVELKRLGYYEGSIDGDIGPLSTRAIRRYQLEHALPPTGTINRPLLLALGLID